MTAAIVITLPPDHSIVNKQEFVNVNGIEYSSDQLLGTTTPGNSIPISDCSHLRSFENNPERS
jgi:hypothetical protein